MQFIRFHGKVKGNQKFFPEILVKILGFVSFTPIFMDNNRSSTSFFLTKNIARNKKCGNDLKSIKSCLFFS